MSPKRKERSSSFGAETVTELTAKIDHYFTTGEQP